MYIFKENLYLYTEKGRKNLNVKYRRQKILRITTISQNKQYIWIQVGSFDILSVIPNSVALIENVFFETFSTHRVLQKVRLFFWYPFSLFSKIDCRLKIFKRKPLFLVSHLHVSIYFLLMVFNISNGMLRVYRSK